MHKQYNISTTSVSVFIKLRVEQILRAKYAAKEKLLTTITVASAKILPVVKNQHQLLCTLLLSYTAAMEVDRILLKNVKYHISHV